LNVMEDAIAAQLKMLGAILSVPEHDSSWQVGSTDNEFTDIV